MRLATFNIYWLGNDKFVEMSGLEERGEDDWRAIARVISRLDADVIAFQEIISLEELEKVLDLASGMTARSYRLNDENGKMLGGGSAKGQKVVFAYDAKRYGLVAASPLLGQPQIMGQSWRVPFGVRLRRLTHGGQVVVVGVHFKSGQPQFTDKDSSTVRAGQCQHLADWVAGKKASSNVVLPQPLAGEHVVILGDFNALRASNVAAYDGVVRSLDPLRADHMKDWLWEDPQADPAGGGPTTSYIEGLLIDYVMLSPSLKDRVIKPPSIYAYDFDPDVTGSFSGDVRYRVSDHRPVYAEIKTSPS